MHLELLSLSDRFAVCRLAPAEPVPAWVPAAGALVVTIRTAHELSIVCDQRAVPDGVRAARGLCALMVCGPLPFDAVGILAGLAGALAAASIPMLAISTFDTDYVLVRDEQLEAASQALRQAGYGVGRLVRAPWDGRSIRSPTRFVRASDCRCVVRWSFVYCTP